VRAILTKAVNMPPESSRRRDHGHDWRKLMLTTVWPLRFPASTLETPSTLTEFTSVA